MDLQELKSKLISERKELAEKIMRLTAKLYSGEEDTEKELISAYKLEKQLSIMTEYYDILSARISDIRHSLNSKRALEELIARDELKTDECCEDRGRCDEDIRERPRT